MGADTDYGIGTPRSWANAGSLDDTRGAVMSSDYWEATWALWEGVRNEPVCSDEEHLVMAILRREGVTL